MKGHEVRARIPKEVFRRYKVVCAELELSIPSQISQMIEGFVDVQEVNINTIKNLKVK